MVREIWCVYEYLISTSEYVFYRGVNPLLIAALGDEASTIVS